MGVRLWQPLLPRSKYGQSDEEIQAWLTEIRTVGHADKKDEPWWPALNSAEDLIKIITTIVWVTSGHHAAVNFDQYAYGAYFSDWATIARISMPTEDPESEHWKNFMRTPEEALLKCFPSQIQATKIMAVSDTLSGHSSDDDPVIKAADEKFCGKLMELEATVDLRNADPSLRNRHGARVVRCRYRVNPSICARESESSLSQMNTRKVALVQIE